MLGELQQLEYIPSEANMLERIWGTAYSQAVHKLNLKPSSLRPPTEVNPDDISNNLAYATYMKYANFRKLTLFSPDFYRYSSVVFFFIVLKTEIWNKRLDSWLKCRDALLAELKPG